MAIAITAAYDSDYQGYQRDPQSKLNVTPIVLKGTVTGVSDVAGLVLQYRVVPFGGGAAVVDWRGGVTLAGDGTFTFKVSGVPQGGFYQWELRTVGYAGPLIVKETLVSIKRWGIGPVILFAGQSIARDMFTTTSTPVVNSKVGVHDQAAWGAPVGDGIAQFTNHMQLAMADDSEDIPVFAVDISVDASALVTRANYLFAGVWENAVFFAARRVVAQVAMDPDDILTRLPIEGAVWIQGSAEATVASLAIPGFAFISQGEYIKGHMVLFDDLFPSAYAFIGKGKQWVLGQLGQIRHNSVTAVDDTINIACPMVRESQAWWCLEMRSDQFELCTLIDFAKDSVDGLHYAADTFESVGARIGYAARRAFKIAPTSVLGGSFTLAPFSRGPRITNAITQKTKGLVRFTVEHDNGVDITVPADSHELFDMQGALKKCNALTVTKIDATHFDVQYDTAQLPDCHVVIVGYAAFSTPKSSLQIVDDNGIPLLPSYSNAGSRAKATTLPENFPLNFEGIAPGNGAANLVVLAVGHGVEAEVGDLIVVFRNIAVIAHRGVRRIEDVSGDVVVVSIDFDSVPLAGDIYRFTSTNLDSNSGRNAQGRLPISSYGLGFGVAGKAVG